MKNSELEALEFVREEDVKFVRLAFCDVLGRLKNVALAARELPSAFERGFAFDPRGIAGFEGDDSRLLLRPDPATLAVLPWRPDRGRVVRMFCDIARVDGSPFEGDSRGVLKRAIADADAAGYRFRFGTRLEFYLFQLDEKGEPTRIPCDVGGYMDDYPDDKAENVRREICLNLESMGFPQESSRHGSGPGQNRIDFGFVDASTVAEQVGSFRAATRTIAGRNGYYADFSPTPLPERPGNAMGIAMAVVPKDGSQEERVSRRALNGLLAKAPEISLLLNPVVASFERARIEPRARAVEERLDADGRRVLEFCAPDAIANPYLVFASLIRAATLGLENGAIVSEPSEIWQTPRSFEDAARLAEASDFVGSFVPRAFLRAIVSSAKESRDGLV
ncbi:MAG: glutamine synthetase [Thermoguttaceae bacterium]|nr:glutamine synthetase [Thermoguttaceae bacterium]